MIDVKNGKSGSSNIAKTVGKKKEKNRERHIYSLRLLY